MACIRQNPHTKYVYDDYTYILCRLHNIAKFSENKELLEKLALLNLLYKYFPVESLEKTKYLYGYLQALDLKLENLENVAKRLQQLGVVSPFIKEKPPHLLVYDVKKYREIILDEIRNLYYSR